MDKRQIQNGDAVSVCESNPHYYSFRGRPALLITSAEHYGAVVNRGFDFVRYLDALHEHELNYTRIYAGAYMEPPGMFMEGNTLGPAPGMSLVPWARSREPGCADGGNKYDLEKWDGAYFDRLKDFIFEADKRDIVVEICFFNCQYPEGWSICPYRDRNNIQGVGSCHYNDVQTMTHGDVLEAQKAYVRKITEEVNGFGNVILEICDEPTYNGTPPEMAAEWIGAIADEIIITERNLPVKHLIAQQLETRVDFSADSRVPVIVSQYILQNENRQIGGVEALETEYAHRKPIEMNETAYYPLWYRGDKIASSRVEAWEFIMGGGAAYNHLNGLYTCKNPAGDCAENRRILAALQSLVGFMKGYAFERMGRGCGFVKGGALEGVLLSGMSEPGNQYLLYIHHSVLAAGSLAYEVAPGDYAAALEVELPGGGYSCQWVSPETGEVLRQETLAHGGGEARLSSPRYHVDIALGIRRISCGV